MLTLMKQFQQIEALRSRIQLLDEAACTAWNSGDSEGLDRAMEATEKAEEELEILERRYQYQAAQA